MKRPGMPRLNPRDARFDGHFFVGVASTGIYCRPICRAKLPRAGNCTYYATAAEAERAGFRPCLQCRPELAPGTAPVDAAASLRAVRPVSWRRIAETWKAWKSLPPTLAAPGDICAGLLPRSSMFPPSSICRLSGCCWRRIS